MKKTALGGIKVYSDTRHVELRMKRDTRHMELWMKSDTRYMELRMEMTRPSWNVFLVKSSGRPAPAGSNALDGF